ncbi:MAG: FKBP-type peptidyl-prolyl cis-trans isomerase [Prevotellaceae bacterium]|nr:FKBP-type peptidyl-prolyl cis-trans isomerase [Prevotellaceae bacterium]
MTTENRLISVSYELFTQFDGGKWKLEETAPADEPFQFVSGMGMTLDDFERKLVSLQKGEKFDFTLSPEQAHGEYVAEAVQKLPRSVFEIDGKLHEKYVYEGAVVPLQNSDGERFNGTIKKIEAEEITVDLNHPLAGCALRFTGEVLENRIATTSEVEQAAKSLSCEGCHGSCGDCEGCEGCGSDCEKI